MCIVYIAYKTHPKYKLVLASNRDEFYSRPTAPAQFWAEHPDILAGKDLKNGGTWLGIAKQGKLALVTNYRDPKLRRPDLKSRGRIVTDFLLTDQDANSFLFNLGKIKREYDPFNLIAGNLDNLWHYSNITDKTECLAAGFYGLSNHLLNTPWPKVKDGLEKFQSILQNEKDFDTQALLELLQNNQIPAQERLPETGVGLEWEQILAPIFTKSADYGTRSTTILTLSQNNEAQFFERSYELERYTDFEQSFPFPAY